MFCCIFGEGYSNTYHSLGTQFCVFNHNDDACRYGSAVGVLAFLACAFFLVVDVYFPQISNATDRKYLVVGDLLFSGDHWLHRVDARGAPQGVGHRVPGGWGAPQSAQLYPRGLGDRAG